MFELLLLILFLICYVFYRLCRFARRQAAKEKTYWQDQKRFGKPIAYKIYTAVKVILTVVIITADHGGKEKGHGGKTLLEMEHPFIICGKGIRHGAVIPGTLMQYDTAATIAHVFSLTTPQSWIGRPALSAFE